MGSDNACTYKESEHSQGSRRKEGRIWEMMVNLVPVMENKPMVLNKERTTVNRGRITPEILRNNRDSKNAISSQICKVILNLMILSHHRLQGLTCEALQCRKMNIVFGKSCSDP